MELSVEEEQEQEQEQVEGRGKELERAWARALLPAEGMDLVALMRIGSADWPYQFDHSVGFDMCLAWAACIEESQTEVADVGWVEEEVVTDVFSSPFRQKPLAVVAMTILCHLALRA